MCEIITILAALVFSVLFFIAKRSGKGAKAFGITALVFTGAALMWLVDCVVSVLEGEAFFDISFEDTVLGLMILGFGLVIFFVNFLKEKAKITA